MFSEYTIGVLALQGDIDEHINMLIRAGVDSNKIIKVKHPEDFDKIDGLILPGGESTAMKTLLLDPGFKEHAELYIKTKKPILGTCAGLILLAKHYSTEEMPGLNVMDITVERNAFGRQIDSCEVELTIQGFSTPYNAVFIRGPRILSVDSNAVEILASFKDAVVFVKQENYFALSFHPELTQDTRIHTLFLETVAYHKASLRS